MRVAPLIVFTGRAAIPFTSLSNASSGFRVASACSNSVPLIRGAAPAGDAPGGRTTCAIFSISSIGVMPASALRELPRVRDADHLAVDEDRRAAHARDHAGAFHDRRVDLCEDEVLPRPDVVQDADDLDVELLDLRPLEDRQAVALHPLPDVRERHALRGLDRVSGPNRGGESHSKGEQRANFPGEHERCNHLLNREHFARRANVVGLAVVGS
jgi:hypothetical protein